MVHSKHIIACLCILLCLFSCRHEEVDNSQMVVEGWIAEGEHPVVLLHRSYDLSQEHEGTFADVMGEQMIIFGRVAISDGEQTVVLTGKVDTNYMPPYIYTTVFMQGEAGKTYHLQADYRTYSASAQTSIPNSHAKIDSISIGAGNITYPVMTAYLSGMEVGEHYALLATTTPRGQYRICPLSTIKARTESTAMDIKYDYATSGLMSGIGTPDQREYDTLYVQLAHIGQHEHAIWDAFAAQSMTQGIFFMQMYSNIPTNINGGNGYWCGMNTRDYIVPIQANTTRRFTK